MAVVTEMIRVDTRGDGHTLDLTPQVTGVVAGSGLRSGVVVLFVIGSTAGLTTIEYEPGAVADLGRAFEKIAPKGGEYEHHLRWGDDRTITTWYEAHHTQAGNRATTTRQTSEVTTC